MVLLVRVVEGWGAAEEWGGSTGGQEGVRLGEVGEGERKRTRRGEMHWLTGYGILQCGQVLHCVLSFTNYICI